MEIDDLKQKLEEAEKLIEKLKQQNKEIVEFDEQLFQIKESIRGLSGQSFFEKILLEIYNHTKLDFLFIGKLKEDKEHFETFAVVYKGKVIDNFEYTVVNSPCENVYGKESLIFEENLQDIFPDNLLFNGYNIEGYIGIPLFSSTEEPLGLFVGLSESKIEDCEKKLALMQFFEERISTEIERINLSKKLDSTEKHFEAFISTIHSIVIFLDTEGCVTYCNEYFLKLTGYTLNEVIGKNWFENFLPIETKEKAFDIFIRVLNNDVTAKIYENEIIFKNGEKRLIKWTNNTFYNEEKSIVRVASYGEDITEKKTIEQELIRSEARFKALAEATTEGIILSKNGIIIDANDRASEITGFSREEVIGKKVIDFVDDEFKEIVRQNIEKNVELGYEVRTIKKDGSSIPVIVNTKMIEYFGSLARLTVFRDISLREKALRELKESEEKYRSLVNYAPIGIAVHCNEKVLFVNQTALKLLECDNEEEILGRSALEFLHPDYRDIVIQRQKQIKETGKAVSILQEIFITKNNKPLEVEVSAIPINYEGKNAIMVMFYDISFRIKAEKKIKESQIKYQTIFNNAPESIFLMDEDIFIECNAKTLEMFGCERDDIIGKPPYLFSPDFQYDGQDSKEKALYYINKAYKGEALTFEWLHKKLNGDLFDAVVSLNIIEFNDKKYLQAIVRDITNERKYIQEIKKLATIIEITPHLVVITDLDGNIEYVNKSYLDKSTYTKEEIIGSKIYRFTTKEHSEKLKKEVIPELLNNNNWQGELDILTKDGTIINGDFVCSVIRDEENHPIYFVAVITDITELKKALTALKESEENLRITLNSIGDAVISTDINGNLVGMNPAAEKLIGWEFEEVKGKNIDDILILYNAKTNEKIQTPIRQVIETGEIVGLANHTKLISRSKEEYQIADSAAPIKDANGKIVGVVMVFRDVTEQYAIREKLRINEDRLSKIMIAANDGMWDWNLLTDEVFFDPRYYTMAGYEVNEFPWHLNELMKRVHPDDIEGVMQEANDHLEGKVERFIVEFRFLTKSGNYMWILARGYIVERDENGKPTRFLGTHTDITERKLMEERLRISEQKFRSLFENMKLGLVLHRLIVDENNKPKDYIFLDMNDAYTEHTGITKDVIGKTVTEVLPNIADDPADWIGRFGNVALTGQSITFEDYSKPLKQWLRVTAFKPDEMQFAVIVDNITKEKELELQLQKVNEVLEERVKERTAQLEDAMKELLIENQKRKQIQEDLLRYQKELRKALKKEKELNMMKSAFISMVSHQYRTPLTVIQTSSDLIPKYFISHNEEKMKYHINRINLSISKMTEMLEKIMMIGKFDVSQDKLDLEEFNINEVVYIEIEKLKEYDKNMHPIKFERSVDEINIYSNRFIIEQIVNNLLSNAAKYSPANSEIKINTIEYDTYVKLIVSDHGIGIDKDELENIFDDFYRGSNVENVYGTGLGLSIVKRFCDKINATIDVKSKINEGSTFTILIPKKTSN